MKRPNLLDAVVDVGHGGTCTNLKSRSCIVGARERGALARCECAVRAVIVDLIYQNLICALINGEICFYITLWWNCLLSMGKFVICFCITWLTRCYLDPCGDWRLFAFAAYAVLSMGKFGDCFCITWLTRCYLDPCCDWRLFAFALGYDARCVNMNHAADRIVIDAITKQIDVWLTLSHIKCRPGHVTGLMYLHTGFTGSPNAHEAIIMVPISLWENFAVEIAALSLHPRDRYVARVRDLTTREVWSRCVIQISPHAITRRFTIDNAVITWSNRRQ